jgi:hypothetical protein
MGSTASLLMLGAAVVAAIGAVGVWVALRRPTRLLQRRQRDEALAAAALYTPAARVPPYGQPAPDPCAPGLSDHQRVDAMRALLLRGDRHAEANEEALAATEPTPLRDEAISTAPMAWKPTLPLEEADLIESRRGLKLRVHLGDHEHISV